MSDSLTEGYKDSPEYARSQERFHAKLKRRNALYDVLREKYPEVAELLVDFYEEKDWH